MIQAESLQKSFGPVRAVKDISFTARDGRITALLGPNGAGKSTTLRMLAAAVIPDAGHATIGEWCVAANPNEVRRSIGVLPHNAGLYARLTGVENIRYFGELQGLRGAELDERLEALVELLDMGDFARRRTAGFSQGQKIKIALARALIHNPQHVILDEPTNGLDVMATRALRSIIRGLKEHGKCILFSSHIMQEVDALCDDVVVIAKGEVKFDGTIEALRNLAGTEDLEEAFIQLAGLEDEQHSGAQV